MTRRPRSRWRMQFGLDTAHPLSTKISKDDVALLDAAAKSMGLPGEAMFEPMQPWLVSVTLSRAADDEGRLSTRPAGST